MKTPAGSECSFFYGDYHRGREIEECRLLKNSTPPQRWEPKLCFTCPVPGIQRANACQHMQLSAEVVRPFFILPRKVQVSAYCTKSKRAVSEPHIGCGECHDLPEIFKNSLE